MHKKSDLSKVCADALGPEVIRDMVIRDIHDFGALMIFIISDLSHGKVLSHLRRKIGSVFTRIDPKLQIITQNIYVVMT